MSAGVGRESLWGGRRLTQKGRGRGCDAAGRQKENQWMMKAVDPQGGKEVVMRFQTTVKSHVLQCIIDTVTSTPPFR